MILELVLTVTSVTGAAAAIVIGRRYVTAAETHSADAADTLAETRILAQDLQDLTARVNNAVEWVEWRHGDQVATHLQLVDRHRHADAREARLAAWQQALLGNGRMPVLSVDELHAQFNALAERIGPLAPPVDDEPTVETPAHLIAVYDGEPGHYVSDAMPADFTAALERVIVERGLDVNQMIAEAETGTDEDEAEQGPDTTVDEPEVETALAGGDSRQDDDAATLPGGGQPPTTPTKVNVLKLGGDIRKLIQEQDEALQFRRVSAVAKRGTLPTPDQPASPQTPPGPPVPSRVGAAA